MNREKNSENYHEAFDRQLFASHSHSHHSHLDFHASDLDSGSDRLGSRSINDKKSTTKSTFLDSFPGFFVKRKLFKSENLDLLLFPDLDPGFFMKRKCLMK